MTWSDTETLRIELIETSINDLQTAANNLATRRELRNLYALLSSAHTQLENLIGQIETSGIGTALSAHIESTTPHFSALDARYYREDEFVSATVGTSTGGSPLKLTSSGVMDRTIFSGAQLDHVSVLDIEDDHVNIETSKTPASASAAGVAGDMAWDSSYIYICVATNTWKRAPLSSW